MSYFDWLTRGGCFTYVDCSNTRNVVMNVTSLENTFKYNVSVKDNDDRSHVQDIQYNKLNNT